MNAVGVIGAGVMGTGVAHSLAETGHGVILIDIDDERIDQAMERIEQNHRKYRLLRDRPPSLGDDSPLGRIQRSTDLEALSDADFVIENITEKWEIKQRLHERVDALVAPDVPIAINTSAIPIKRFASVYDQPPRVVGMHFMNPVPLMPVVEIIRAATTSERAVSAATELVDEMGKQSIVVNDSPGFVTNRVMMLMVNEAIFILQENVADVRDIDQLFKTCFNHRMGPLATADMIGLDTVLYSIEVLHRELADDKYRPCPMLRQMVKEGKFGRKNGKGFYDYSM